MRKKIKLIFDTIKEANKSISKEDQNNLNILCHTLVKAEDRRAKFHLGIDPISILRAIFVSKLRKKIQGISTIEQQLFRTIIPREGNLYKSKSIEIFYSIIISVFFSEKRHMASLSSASVFRDGPPWV